MPTIITDAQQANALAEIEEALAVIKSINTITAATGGSISILYTPERGRKISVPLNDAGQDKALRLLSATKARLVKLVNAKAARHRISLDEHDLACMSGVDAQAAESDEFPGAAGQATEEGTDGATEEETESVATADMEDAGHPLF